MAELLEGKRGVVFGVANKRSIAWAIAQSLAGAGAQLAITYQNERLEENAKSLAAELKDAIILRCDVQKDNEVKEVFRQIESRWGSLDFLVHSLAFAKAEELEGEYIKASRDGFALAVDVSAYSLTLLAREARGLLAKNGGSIVAMTYIGGERAVPGYNTMGVAKAALECSIKYLANDLGPQNIRVNAISAGPINTLAARGIKGFADILKHVGAKAALKRNIEAAEVGDTALFLCSPLSRGVTGEIIHVDAGYHCIGL
jgi:enoyl-[acyl-carrier protein] reductase I